MKSINWTAALFSETDSTRPAFPNAVVQEVKSSVSHEADTTLPHRTVSMWCPSSWRQDTDYSGEPAWSKLCPVSLCWLSLPPTPGVLSWTRQLWDPHCKALCTSDLPREAEEFGASKWVEWPISSWFVQDLPCLSTASLTLQETPQSEAKCGHSAIKTTKAWVPVYQLPWL